MPRRYIALILAALIAFALVAVGCSQASSQKQDTGTQSASAKVLTVGSDTYPPFIYADENGNTVGIDADIVTEVANRLGYSVRFKFINWEEKDQLLKEGEIDCVIGSFSMTGRESLYKWAGPYLKSRQVIAVTPSSDINNLADLEGKTVAVQATTKPEGILLDGTNKEIGEVANVFSFADRTYLVPALLKGYVDAVGAHESSLSQYQKDYNVELKILPDSLLEVGLGIAFDLNDDSGLDEQFNQVLSDMHQDGTMREILSKYVDNPDTYLNMDGLQ